MEENSEGVLEDLPKNDEISQEAREVVVQEVDLEEFTRNNEQADKLKEYESAIESLKDELAKKTDVIANLEKQKASFEKESNHVRDSSVPLLTFPLTFKLPAAKRSRECCHSICYS